MTETEKAFNAGMKDMAAIFQRDFSDAAVRIYWEACKNWSAERISEAFKRALQSERFCPPPAVIIAYGAGIHERARSKPDYPDPKLTAEQLDDLERMRKRFNESKPDVPWADDPSSTASIKL